MSGKSSNFRISLAALAVLALTLGPVVNAAESAKETSAREAEQKLEAARRRLEEAARDVAEISRTVYGDTGARVMALRGGGRQRAMLGMAIGNSDRDSGDGVEILSVSPGGPAEAAGLKAGDVLTEINGKSLKADGKDSSRQKLLDVTAELNAGDKVAVSYRRDGKVATASVVAQPLGDRLFSIQVPDFTGRFEGLPNVAFARAAGVFGSAELVTLTPKLGQYFGTEKGLLVVRAPTDTRLQLEEGDVILDIDGRTPASAAHALRILGSYQSGEKLKLNVLRMKKRVSFEITIPNETWERGIRRSRVLSYPSAEMAVSAAPLIQALPVPAPPAPPVFDEAI